MSVIDISKDIGLSILSGIKKHGALICTIGASTLLIVTTGCAIHDTKKYMILKYNEEERLGRELTNEEKIKLGMPVYINTALSGASTLALTWGAFGLNKRAINGLNSSLILLGRQLENRTEAYRRYYEETKQYLPQTEEEYKKLNKIIGGRKSDIPTDGESPNSEPTKPGSIVYINDPNALIHFKEVDTGVQYFKSWNEFNAALNKVNADINREGFVPINRFYEYLGVDESEIGWDTGWDQIVGFDYDPSFECEHGNVPEFVLRIMFTKCPTQKCR